MKEKLDDRDTAVSALVKSSTTLETCLQTMKAEMKKAKCNAPANSGFSGEIEAVLDMKEMTQLHCALADHGKVKEKLFSDWFLFNLFGGF